MGCSQSKAPAKTATNGGDTSRGNGHTWIASYEVLPRARRAGPPRADITARLEGHPPVSRNDDVTEVAVVHREMVSKNDSKLFREHCTVPEATVTGSRKSSRSNVESDTDGINNQRFSSVVGEGQRVSNPKQSACGLREQSNSCSTESFTYDTGEIHVCASSGCSVVWSCPAPFGASSQTRVCSPWFKLPARILNLTTHIEWRLFWEMHDSEDDTRSLYLECRQADQVFQGQQGGVTVVDFTTVNDVSSAATELLSREDGEIHGSLQQQWEVDTCFSFALLQPANKKAATNRHFRHWRQTQQDMERERHVHQHHETNNIYATPNNISSNIGNEKVFNKTFGECCCGNDCLILDAIQFSQRYMDMAMVHRFTNICSDNPCGFQWGAHDYLTLDDVYRISGITKSEGRCHHENKKETCEDLFIELRFHGVQVTTREASSSGGAESSVPAFHPQACQGRVACKVGPSEQTILRDVSTTSMRNLPLSSFQRALPLTRCLPLMMTRVPFSPNGNDTLESLLGTSGSSVQLLSLSPLLLVFDHFLSAVECDDLVAIAAPDLRRSRVTDGKLSEGRTSSSTFLTGCKQEEPLVRAIEQRLLRAVQSATLIAAQPNVYDSNERHGQPYRGSTSRFSQRPNLLQGAEPMQVVRYTEGQMYTAHYDNKQGCLRRTATFMMYLTDVHSGGATHFPRAVPVSMRDGCGDAAGIRIWPKRGRALVFWSVSGGIEDVRSLHEAEPVIEGEKWIATKWLREDEDLT